MNEMAILLSSIDDFAAPRRPRLRRRVLALLALTVLSEQLIIPGRNTTTAIRGN